MRFLPLCWLATVLAARMAAADVVSFGAKGDGETLNTQALQRAIDACPAGGTVEIPEGIFRTGALFLKSDLTLHLARGAVLQGSTKPRDYEPLIRNRFEGWEMDTYASLINAGKLDHGGGDNVHNIAIRGEGTIRGGGAALAKAMIAARGMRSRGRLICVMNCRGLDIEGLLVEQSPSWTIHYIYSTDVTCRGLTIRSTVTNGDGIDPDSSTNCLISHCTFSTGDDCIAIKSGKNPEGGIINRPTENVRIEDCQFTVGHGISIGSETSGSVRHVIVERCSAGNLKNGLQIKATPARGGEVSDIVVRDCSLQKIRVLTALPYNNDGAAAPSEPIFRDFHFSHLDMTQAPVRDPAIVIDGFDSPGHRTSNVSFDQVSLPPGAAVQVDRCSNVSFHDVVCSDGKAPAFSVSRSDQVSR